MVHSISLPPGEYGGDAIERLFTNTLDWDAHPYFQSIRDLKVSAHFVIRRSGKLLQFVSCDRRAWHAGVSQWRGRDNCNDYSIGIELEGLEGERFESAQYTQLAALLRAVARRYRIEAVVGHEHIAPTRKHDPGMGFDWVRLARATALVAGANAVCIVNNDARCNSKAGAKPIEHAPVVVRPRIGAVHRATTCARAQSMRTPAFVQRQTSRGKSTLRLVP